VHAVGSESDSSTPLFVDVGLRRAVAVQADRATAILCSLLRRIPAQPLRLQRHTTQQMRSRPLSLRRFRALSYLGRLIASATPPTLSHLADDGTVWFAGQNNDGMFGTGSDQATLSPLQPTPLPDWAERAIGSVALGTYAVLLTVSRLPFRKGVYQKWAGRGHRSGVHGRRHGVHNHIAHNKGVRRCEAC